MPESRTALDAALSARWTRIGEWVATQGARMCTRAQDIETGDIVRITAVFCADDGMATASLAREIGALECLAHQPAVLPLLETARAAGWLYMITPWHTESVRAQVARNGPLGLVQALDHAIAVADLLHFAHSIDVAHGAMSADALFVDAGQVHLGDFAGAARLYTDAERALAAARDVHGLAEALFEMLTATRWTERRRVPDALPAVLLHSLFRALSDDTHVRFASAIVFAQSLCGVRDAILNPEPEVSARDAVLAGAIDAVPLSDGADRSLRVLHALLDRAEVADLSPEPDDPLVMDCWERASAQVSAGDARLVALQCRWQLLAERDPVGALSASQRAPDAPAVMPYRARALAAVGRAAEARTLAVRTWFGDVALDLASVRSLIVALLLTRAFEMATLVSVTEREHGVVDPVIIAAGETAVARGAARRLSPAAQTRTLNAIASALQRRVSWTGELLFDPRWDALRTDHRFVALLAQSKSTWTT